MYSLDINFLNDRPELRPKDGGSTTKRRPQPAGSFTPLILGVVVGLLPLGLVGGLWFLLQDQNSKLEQQKSELNSKLQQAQAEQKKVEEIKKQAAQVRDETKNLASEFNKIKPWSAMLQDLRDRIPPGIQIVKIEQVETTPTQQGATPTPSPAASPGSKSVLPKAPPPPAPSPISKLMISGQANSFDTVNDFLLMLQRSAFVKKDETQIIKAELVKNSNKLETKVQDQKKKSSATVTYELPKVVAYQIQTTLSDVPASDLLRELDKNGAVGLVTRLRTLQEKGVQP